MQPVPVQTSRILRLLVGFCPWGRDGDKSVRIWFANSRVYASVSGRGMRTPLWQRMERSPKGWSPRTYWRGIPFARWEQSWKRRRECGNRDGVDAMCSRIQRSSLCTEERSRQMGRRAAPWGERRRARQKREGGRRGIFPKVFFSHDFRMKILGLVPELRSGIVAHFCFRVKFRDSIFSYSSSMRKVSISFL